MAQGILSVIMAGVSLVDVPLADEEIATGLQQIEPDLSFIPERLHVD